jgi:hypothetical protein
VTEKFLPIPGFEGFYEVSDEGNVRSVKRKISIKSKHGLTRTFQSKEISKIVNDFGYVIATLCLNGDKKTFRVHRLVLMAFCPNPKSAYLDVNHKNGVKTDNSIQNLEWVTRSENLKHRYRVLKQKHSMDGKFGINHHRSISITGKNEHGNVVCEFNSLMDAQRAGFQPSKISNCLSGKRKTHGGLIWSKNLRGFV